MNSAPKKTLRDFREGEAVSGLFRVSQIEIRETKTTPPRKYLQCQVSDRSGTLPAIKWELDGWVPAAESCYARLQGDLGSFKGRPQLRLARISPVDDREINPADFLPASRHDPQAMRRAFLDLVARVEDAHLHGLLESCFHPREIMEAFATAPAAIAHHHNYLHGLLEHTLELGQAAWLIAPVFPECDPGLLLTGALLHDLGKIREYTWDKDFSRSDEGELLEHIAVGVSLLQGFLARRPGFPPELASGLLHLVASHHRLKEWGSPVVPTSPEARLFHYLDNLFAKARPCEKLLEESRGRPGTWTEYDKSLNTRLYRGDPSPEPPPPSSGPLLETSLDSLPHPGPHAGTAAAVLLPARDEPLEMLWTKYRKDADLVASPALGPLLHAALAAARSTAPADDPGPLSRILREGLTCCAAARRLAPLFPALDHDLLAAGILLRDFGPLVAPERTERLGHLLALDLWLEPRLTAAGLPGSLSLRLRHLLASHHGTREEGSSVPPRTLEACVLYHLDQMARAMTAPAPAPSLNPPPSQPSERLTLRPAPDTIQNHAPPPTPDPPAPDRFRQRRLFG